MSKTRKKIDKEEVAQVVLEDEMIEKAKKERIAKREKEHAAQYTKDKIEKEYVEKIEIRFPGGSSKFKHIRVREYKNGVVKRKLVKMTKNLGSKEKVIIGA